MHPQLGLRHPLHHCLHWCCQSLGDLELRVWAQDQDLSLVHWWFLYKHTGLVVQVMWKVMEQHTQFEENPWQACTTKYPMVCEVNTCSCQLIQPLVHQEHLLHRLEMAWSLPRFLHGFNVFWFCNWWTDPIQSPKGANVPDVVDKSMLTGYIEPLHTNTALLKYLVVVVESVECILSLWGLNWCEYCIEQYSRTPTMHGGLLTFPMVHILRPWASKPVETDTSTRLYGVLINDSHLHQSFRIISCPLLETPTFVEVPKPWECRGKSNSK